MASQPPRKVFNVSPVTPVWLHQMYTGAVVHDFLTPDRIAQCAITSRATWLPYVIGYVSFEYARGVESALLLPWQFAVLF